MNGRGGFVARKPDGWRLGRLLDAPQRLTLVQSLRIRLLAMLHIGFTWLGLALLLAGIARLADSSYGATTALGLAATHAYTMGFLGSTMFAMVTRVSCGHSGRTVGVSPVAAAAVGWAGVCAAWAARCASWYGRPRLDGRPG